MFCVLWAKGLENKHICWCGLERFGTREGGVGGWRHLVIWWGGENISLLFEWEGGGRKG